MRQARTKQLYEVKVLDYSYFKDHEHAEGVLSSIRPGKKVSDPTVTDLRGLLFLPTGEIKYKLRHTDS